MHVTLEEKGFQMLVLELTVYTLSLTHWDKKKAGFGGTFMPLTAARGGTLFLDKYWWKWNVLHTHSTLSTLLLLCKYLPTSRRFSLSFAAEDRSNYVCTIKLLVRAATHINWSFLHKIILWKVEIKSLKQFACLCWVSLHIFVCPLTFI